MAFTIKNFDSIVAALIERTASSTSQLTDFNVGSKIRTMLEAFAQELEGLYMQLFTGLLEAIDTGVFNAFDFPALPAVAASGPITFSLFVAGTTTPLAPTTNISIPAGFRLQIPVQTSITLIAGQSPSGTLYTIANNVVWPAGQTTFTTTAVCATAGTIGNTIANTITTMVDTIPPVSGGVFSVTNPAPFSNGLDQESDTSRKARFSSYLQSLQRGTLGAIEYGALQADVTNASGIVTEQVKKVYAVEDYTVDGSKPIGNVDVYIYNGVGNTSAALVSSAQNIIDGYTDVNGNNIPGYKAAGVIVTVQAAIEQQQDITINTTWSQSYSLTPTSQSQMAAAIQQYVDSLNPGDTLVYNKLVEVTMQIPGIYDVQFITPVGDVIPPNPQTIITLGSINIS